MRRMPPPPTQEELDDIEDNQWRRKSYALAQHNALPLPMPLPIHPPPKPCPPPANPVIVRPPRIRPPQYPPGQGYRPSAGYHRLTRMGRPPASGLSDRLPTLAEGGSACPTPEMPQRRAVPIPVTPPMVPQSLPYDQKRQESPFTSPALSTHEKPRISSFQESPATPTLPQTLPHETSRISPHQESPAAPSVGLPPTLHPKPTFSSFQESPAIPHTPSPAPHRSLPQSLSTSPTSQPPSSTLTPPPVAPQRTTQLPTPTTQPPQPTIQPPQPTTQPSQSTTHAPQPTTQPPQPTTQPLQPSTQPTHRTTQPPHPSPSLDKHPPPQNSPLPRKNPPSLPTKPPPTHRGTRPGRRGIPHPSPSPRPSIPPPAVPTKPPPSPKIQAPARANPDPENAPKPIHPEQVKGTPTGPSPSEVIPRVMSAIEKPGENMYDLNDPLALKENSSPSENIDSPREHKLHDPGIEQKEQAPQNKIQTTSSVSQPEETIVTPNPEVTQTIPMKDNKPSTLPNSPISQDLPPTPTSQHLPPTPPSLSRPSTPTSLGRPRTPTSIRAAPSWQPIFLPAPKTPTGATTNSEPDTPISLTPATTPRPLTQQPTPLNNTQVFPPTPPSSLSHVGQESCTPYSSLNSLNHGPSKTSMGEDEVQHEPEGEGAAGAGTETGTELPYPAVLDAASLHTQTTKTPATPALVEAPQDTISRASQETYQTYRTRFWVLAVFSCIAFLQTTVWGTFGPIAESAQAAFPSWTDATIAAFPNWGPIIVVIFTIPMMWLTQKLGLRLGMLVCAILLTVGTVLRCFTSEETPFTILCHVSSILFAFAACLVLSLPAMLSATWFPPSERITATAVGTLMCNLGGAGMYLSPLMVRYPSKENPSDQDREDIRGDIMILMYTHFGVAALLLVAVCVYFPARPPTPPSASSAKERIDYFSGIKGIVKNRPLMLVLAVYAFSFGVPVVWIGVLTLSLLEIDIHQEQAMGVAVVAVVSSCIGSFITARIADRMYGHLRVTIMVLLGLSSCFFLWFLLLSTKVIATDLAQVYIAVSGGLCFEYATVPLLVELAVELGYPIPESVTGATLTFVFNVVALVFLGIFQIPNIKHLWVSYVLLACVSLTLLPLFLVKETHKRSDTDRKHIHKDT